MKESKNKTIAVMQPYFFPYIGYFSLIESVDYFMFFDNVQFIRKSWMGRNRLLNIDKNRPFYIRPNIIKPAYQEILPNVKLGRNEKWKIKLLEQIKGYKNKAPFYEETEVLLEQILQDKYKYLVEFNCQSTLMISEWIRIEVAFDKYSAHDFMFEETPTPGSWGREIAKKLEARAYINAPGGEDFIFPEGFTEAGIKLGFIQVELEKYDQGNLEFVPGLSILDSLLFNGRSKTKELVDNYKVKWKN